MYSALYARQSVDKKDSISVESQLEFCRYDTRGSKYKEYIDKGFSGKNTNRPAFSEMYADIEKGLIDKVIVYKLDRISRSILDFSNMMGFFQKCNVEFVSSTEKFDTSTPIGRAMLNICIVFAQLERETIQKRITDSHYSRVKKGYYKGTKIPYGFQKESIIMDGIKTYKYIPVEEEIEQIKLIFSMYSEPKCTLGDVSRHLHSNGIKKLRGKSWQTQSFRNLIYNPIYVKADSEIYNFYKSQGVGIINDVSEFNGKNACYLYTEEGHIDCKGRNTMQNKFLVIAPHEGVVPSDEWLQCRIKCLNNRKLPTTRKGKLSWLVGRMKCGSCGRAASVVTSGKEITDHFRCRGRATDKNGCEGFGYIKVEKLEDYIFQKMKDKLSDFEVLSSNTRNILSPKINENKLKISAIDKKIESLLEKIADANDVLMKYINEKVEDLDIERKGLQKNIIILSSSMSNTTDVKKVTDYISRWNEIDLNQKTSVVDALIKSIALKRDNIEITWKI